MHLKSIQVSNFKAFGKEFQTIPIKPITLVFGPNSAGKSSVIHSLLWLNHAETRGETDVYRPALAEKSVNLGGFDACLNRQSGMHRLRMEMTVANPNPDRGSPCWEESASAFTLRFECSRVVKGQKPEITGIEFSSDEESLLRIRKNPHREVRFPGKLEGRICEKHTMWLAGVTRFPASDDVLDSALEVEAQCIWATSSTFLPSVVSNHRTRREIEEFDDWLFTKAPQEELLAAKEYLAKSLCLPVTHILSEIARICRDIVYLPPLREIPDRSTDLHGCNLLGWRLIAGRPEMHDQVNRTLEHLKIPHRLSVRTLIPTSVAEDAIYDVVARSDGGDGTLSYAIDAAREQWDGMNRRDHEMWIESYPDFFDKLVEWERDAIDDWDGYRDAVESDFRDKHPDSSEETMPEWWINEWAEEKARDMVANWANGNGFWEEEARDYYISVHPKVREAIGQALRSRGLKAALLPGDGHLQLRLHDPKRNIWVSLQEVGVGTSQILPIILEAHGQRNKMILIEQPELHLHPALQAELGDVFIESALGENKNTFLLETHSEHLILRLLRRIRETAEGETDDWPEALRQACPNGVRPEDVAVLYVEPGEEGARVIELPVTDDGDFARPWPGGFFAERSKELF